MHALAAYRVRRYSNKRHEEIIDATSSIININSVAAYGEGIRRMECRRAQQPAIWRCVAAVYYCDHSL